MVNSIVAFLPEFDSAISVTVIGGAAAFLAKWLWEWFVSYLRLIERQVSIIDALTAELEITATNAARFHATLTAGKAKSTLARSAARRNYFPYIPVGTLRNIAFDLYKGETDFLSKSTTKALFEVYLTDDLVFACASDFRSDAFKGLAKPRKIAAIGNAASAANGLHDLAQHCLVLLAKERRAINRAARLRKWFHISTPDTSKL